MSELPKDPLPTICTAVDDRFDEQVVFPPDLVRCVSLRGSEEAVQDLVESALRARRYAIDRFPIDAAQIGVNPAISWAAPEHSRGTNIVAVGRGGSDDVRSLALNAHVDVVPAGVAARWATDPFEPVVTDGWLHGRGAADMKAGLSA